MKKKITKILTGVIAAGVLLFTGGSVQAQLNVLKFSAEENIENIEGNIDLLADRVIHLDELSDTLEGEVSDLLDQLEDKNLTLEEKERIVNELNDIISNLEDQLDNSYTAEEVHDLIAGYIEEVARYKEIADERLAEIERLNKEIAKLRETNNKLVDAIEGEKEKVEQLIKERDQLQELADDYKELFIQQRKETEKAHTVIQELEQYSNDVVEDVLGE